MQTVDPCYAAHVPLQMVLRIPYTSSLVSIVVLIDITIASMVLVGYTLAIPRALWEGETLGVSRLKLA